MASKKVAMVNLEDDVKEVPKNKVSSLVLLVKEQQSIEARIAAAQDNLDSLTKTLRAMIEDTIPSFFDEVGVKALTLPDGTIVTVEEKVYPNITAANWAAAYTWLKKNGFESIVKTELKVKFGKGENEKFHYLQELLVENGIEDYSSKVGVNPQTLGAFVREQLAAGKDLPLSIDINPVRKSSIKVPKLK